MMMLDKRERETLIKMKLETRLFSGTSLQSSLNRTEKSLVNRLSQQVRELQETLNVSREAAELKHPELANSDESGNFADSSSRHVFESHPFSIPLQCTLKERNPSWEPVPVPPHWCWLLHLKKAIVSLR